MNFTQVRQGDGECDQDRAAYDENINSEAVQRHKPSNN